MSTAPRTARTQEITTASNTKILPTGSIFDAVGVVPDLYRDSMRWSSPVSATGAAGENTAITVSEGTYTIPTTVQRALSSFQEMMNPPSRPEKVFCA